MSPKQFETILRDLGYGQTEIAELLGELPRQVRRWIAGHSRIPKGTAIVMRALALDIISEEQVEQLKD